MEIGKHITGVAMVGTARSASGAGNSRGLARSVALPFAGLLLAIAPAQHVSAANPDGTSEFALFDASTANSEADQAVADQDDVWENARDLGTGVASYYGARFAGKPTASGEPFNPAELTAAHRSLPFGSKVLVTSKHSGKSVVVTINDRGPFHGGRIIDLSKAAASRIGLVRQGHGSVKLALLAD
jgi:rare lipoprotein A